MVAALVALILIASPDPALEGPTESQLRFKEAFTRGEALFGEGEFGAAIFHFRSADKLKATPEVAFDLAKCHQKLGDEALAAYYYRLYLRRAPRAGDTLEVAEEVGEVLSRAEDNGRGLLEVESVGSGSVVVSGQTFPDFPVAVFLPPGDYELVGQFPTGEVRKSISILNGKAQTTTLVPPLVPLVVAPDEDKASAQALQVEPSPAPVPGSPPSNRSGLKLAGYALVGVGVGGLVAGTALGLVSRSQAQRYQDGRGTLTVAQAREAVLSANGKGAAANALWVGGAAAALGGAITFVFALPEPGSAGGAR